MTPEERERFDRLFDEVLEELPPALHDLFEEKPLIIDDAPDEHLRREMGVEDETELLGLHTGVPLTERSVDDAPGLEVMHLFREGIIEHAGGWEPWVDEDGHECGGEEAIREEIRITLLHEIGHHFGLDEDDLARLGYE